jgi:hypothetical protein
MNDSTGSGGGGWRRQPQKSYRQQKEHSTHRNGDSLDLQPPRAGHEQASGMLEESDDVWMANGQRMIQGTCNTRTKADEADERHEHGG